MQDEDADERQRDPGHLIADERDRLSGEEAPEGHVLSQQDGHEPRRPKRQGQVSDGHARLTVTSPLIVRARKSTEGPPDSGGVSLTSSSEDMSPLIELASM